MRISDWSSDVCSSDLLGLRRRCQEAVPRGLEGTEALSAYRLAARPLTRELNEGRFEDRKSVVSGKSVSVRVDIGGRRINKKKNISIMTTHRENLNTQIFTS